MEYIFYLTILFVTYLVWIKNQIVFFSNLNKAKHDFFLKTLLNSFSSRVKVTYLMANGRVKHRRLNRFPENELIYNRVPPVYTIHANVLYRQRIRKIITNILHRDRTRADRFIYIYLNNVGAWKALTTVNSAFSGPVVDRKGRTTAGMRVRYNGCTTADVNLQVINDAWNGVKYIRVLTCIWRRKEYELYSYNGVFRYPGYSGAPHNIQRTIMNKKFKSGQFLNCLKRKSIAM